MKNFERFSIRQILCWQSDNLFPEHVLFLVLLLAVINVISDGISLRSIRTSDAFLDILRLLLSSPFNGTKHGEEAANVIGVRPGNVPFAGNIVVRICRQLDKGYGRVFAALPTFSPLFVPALSPLPVSTLFTIPSIIIFVIPASNSSSGFFGTMNF